MAEALPFGLRDVKLTPIADDGTLGTMVDLPNAQTLSFEESEEFVELRGDDKLVTKRGSGASVGWELAAGGISLEALVVLNGGELTTSGVAPNTKLTYKKAAYDARPLFRAEGQAMSEAGGDVHAVLYECKMDESFSGEFGDGAFFVTSASGTAYPSADNADALYDFVQNETATAIVQPT